MNVPIEILPLCQKLMKAGWLLEVDYKPDKFHAKFTAHGGECISQLQQVFRELDADSFSESDWKALVRLVRAAGASAKRDAERN